MDDFVQLFLIFRGLGDRRDDAGSLFVILAVESKGTGVGEPDQLFDLTRTRDRRATRIRFDPVCLRGGRVCPAFFDLSRTWGSPRRSVSSSVPSPFRPVESKEPGVDEFDQLFDLTRTSRSPRRGICFDPVC